MTGYITPRTFRFFSELTRHNDREWFEGVLSASLRDLT